MTIFKAAILLFLVMDPFGNIPVFLVVLKGVPRRERLRTIVRELLIALAVLVLFLFVGPSLLQALQISEPSMRIAGGIILFLIAVKMIFGAPEEMFRRGPDEIPLIVPLAIPCIAGPSAVATILVLTGQEPGRWPEWLLALLIAWLLTSLILLLAATLDRLLGQRGLNAAQHLMGLLLTAIAVEMLIQGIRAIFFRQL